MSILYSFLDLVEVGPLVCWLRMLMCWCSFGVTSFVLEMVPFVSLVFTFTNTVGAALWAADLERVVQ